MGPDAEQAQQDTPGTAPASGTRLRDMVVVGASAGGVQALSELVRGLPADLPAALMIVLHMSPKSPGALASILRRVSSLEVTAADDLAPVRRGRVYVARPNCHLLLRDGEVRLGRGPRENGHRPAVDPLFRSAARWYGSRAVAVVLSGTMDDGAAGAVSVARRGGAVAVQDPADALYDSMPRAALRAVGSAVVAPVTELSGHITRLVQGPAGELAGDVPAELTLETDLAELASEALHQPERPGLPSGVSCPDCHGVLYELDDKEVLRYRCRVGHAWSPASLEASKDQEVENAMWIAVRNLEERTALYRDLAEQSRRSGRSRSADLYEDRYRQAEGASEVIRGLLTGGELGFGDSR
jgi:two-component system, chemotaxis family, protein-glutamate methylesterase/glutaminase